MYLILVQIMYRGEIMIIEEQVPNRPDLVKTRSDENFYIQNDQTGCIMKEAIDLIGVYTYTETD